MVQSSPVPPHDDEGTPFTNDELDAMLRSFREDEDHLPATPGSTLAPPTVVAPPAPVPAAAALTNRLAGTNGYAAQPKTEAHTNARTRGLHTADSVARTSLQKQFPASTRVSQPEPAGSSSSSNTPQEAEPDPVVSRPVASTETAGQVRLRRLITAAQTRLEQAALENPTTSADPTRFNTKWEKALREARVETPLLCSRIEELGRLNDPRSVSILKRFAHAKQKKVRFQTARALRDVDTAEGQSVLLSLLKDPKPKVARAAMAGLIRHLNDITLSPAIAYGLLNNEAAALLGAHVEEMGGPAIRDQLFDIASSSDRELALQALKLAGRLCDKDTVSKLSPYTQHGDPHFRRVAIECLIRTDNQQVVRFLNKALSDTDAQVRARAAQGLHKWASNSSGPRLLPLLSDRCVDVRRNAAKALRELARPDFTDQISLRLSQEEDDATLGYLIDGLGRTKEKAAAKAIMPFTDSENPNLRIAALSALTRLKDKRATAGLIRLLDDPDARIRQKVLDGLAQPGNTESLSEIAQLLTSDRDTQVRSAAARALGTIGSRRAIDPLSNALYDESPVRCQAVIALGKIGGSEVIPHLHDRLRDSAPEVRYNAVTGLGELQSRESVPAIRDLIEDPEEMVQRAVRRVLADLGYSVSTDLAKRRLGRIASRLRTLVPSWQVAAVLLATCLVLGGGTIWMFPGLVGIRTGPPLLVMNALHISTSPAGDQVAIVRERGVVDLWSVSTGELLTRFAPPQPPAGLLFTPDSKTLFLLGSGTESRWDMNPDHEPVRGSLNYPQLQSVAAATMDRKYLVTTGPGGTSPLLWGPDRQPEPLKLPRALAQTVAISEDGKRVAGVDLQNNVRIVEAPGGNQVTQFRLTFPDRPRARVTAVAFSPDAQQLAFGLSYGEVSIVDLQQGALSTLVAEASRVADLHWVNSQLISVHSEEIRFIDPAIGEAKILSDLPVKNVGHSSLSATGTTLAVAGIEGKDAAVVDVPGRRVRHIFRANQP